MIDGIVVDVLLVCMVLWHENAFPRGVHRSPDSTHNEPEMKIFDFSFVISLGKLLNE